MVHCQSGNSVSIRRIQSPPSIWRSAQKYEAAALLGSRSRCEMIRRQPREQRCCAHWTSPSAGLALANRLGCLRRMRSTRPTTRQWSTSSTRERMSAHERPSWRALATAVFSNVSASPTGIRGGPELVVDVDRVEMPRRPTAWRPRRPRAVRRRRRRRGRRCRGRTLDAGSGPREALRAPESTEREGSRSSCRNCSSGCWHRRNRSPAKRFAARLTGRCTFARGGGDTTERAMGVGVESGRHCRRCRVRSATPSQ